MTLARRSFVGVAALALVAGCANRNYLNVGPPGGSASATPTGDPSATATSPQSSASPIACVTTPNSAAKQIAISFQAGLATDPTYGAINGYATISGGFFASTAEVITAVAGDTVQFFNGDAAGTHHSAVGFGTVTAFPATPYTFAVTSTRTVGTAIGTAPWSTGILDGQCYSPAFAVPTAGTFYFGDYDAYDSISSIRDVIVVGAH